MRKQTMIALSMMAVSAAVLAQPSSRIDCQDGSKMADARQKIPAIKNLPDDSAVRVIQRVYYPDMSTQEVADALCVKLEVEKEKRTLGVIDKWRYESCQQEAAKAPTHIGVNTGLKICREKFDQ